MFNKNKKEHYIASQLEPLHADNSELSRRIVATSEALGLDYQKAIIVGSAALYLYGVTPPRIIDPIARKQLNERPGDVDHAITAPLFNAIFQANQTANGTSVDSSRMTHYGEQYTLRVQPNNSDHLDADLITRFSGNKEPIEQQERFIADHKADSTIPGSNARVARLDIVYDELERRSRLDPKAKEDFQALQQFIRQQER